MPGALWRTTAGVDEAGRGPVLGPLVVAGVRVGRYKKLSPLGIKDSKLLTPQKRETLFPKIHDVAEQIEIRVVPADELDRRMGRHNLNRIEVELFAEILDALAPDRAYVDACDVNEERFGLSVHALLAKPCAVVSEHQADARRPVVGAASIVAKVVRDRALAEIARELGEDVGSGYSHDPITQAFLRGYVKENGKLPPCARRRWETSERLVRSDRSLLDFPR